MNSKIQTKVKSWDTNVEKIIKTPIMKTELNKDNLK